MLDSMIHPVPMARSASLTLVTPGIHDTFEQHFSHDHTIRIMPRFVCSYLFLVMAITAITTAVATNTTTTTSNDDVKQEYVRSLSFVHDQEETLRGTKTKDVNKTTWRGLRGSTNNQQGDNPSEVSQDVVHEVPSEIVVINDKDSVASPRGGSLDDPDAFKRGGIAVNTRSKRHHHHQRVLTDSNTVGADVAARVHGSVPLSPSIFSFLFSLGVYYLGGTTDTSTSKPTKQPSPQPMTIQPSSQPSARPSSSPSSITEYYGDDIYYNYYYTDDDDYFGDVDMDDSVNPSPCSQSCYGFTCDHVINHFGLTCDDLVYICDCSGNYYLYPPCLMHE